MSSREANQDTYGMYHFPSAILSLLHYHSIMFMELTHPLCAAWMNQLIKRRLSEERKYYERYGCVVIRIEQCHVSQNRTSRPSYPSTSAYMPFHPSTSSHMSNSPKVHLLIVIFQ